MSRATRWDCSPRPSMRSGIASRSTPSPAVVASRWTSSSPRTSRSRWPRPAGGRSPGSSPCGPPAWAPRSVMPPTGSPAGPSGCGCWSSGRTAIRTTSTTGPTGAAAGTGRGSTRMGAAIRHATDRLARRPERMRVLVVVSDGYPDDIDYGPDRRDVEYGLRDTARAIEQARGRGIDTLLVTVDRASHDYLRRMCPPGRYRVIEEIDSLAGEIARAYRTMTG